MIKNKYKVYKTQTGYSFYENYWNTMIASFIKGLFDGFVQQKMRKYVTVKNIIKILKNGNTIDIEIMCAVKKT